MSNLKNLITVPSGLISPSSSVSLTPAMTAVLWRIAAELDERRVPAQAENAVWMEIRAIELRGPASRPDNLWLRECLERLTGMQISGEWRGAPWGAVMIAEWHLEKGGETVRLLVPPAAVQALRAPATFAKIETEAVFRLHGRASRLYAALADKKHLQRNWWIYSLDELRAVFGVEGGYPSWRDLRRRLIQPAVKSINDFGTVSVEAVPEKQGRRVTAVRFTWRWKSLDEARRTAAETEDAAPYSGGQPAVPTAPPLMPETQTDRWKNEEKWWNELPSEQRRRLEERWRAELPSDPRGPGGEHMLDELLLNDIRRAAYEEAHPDDPPFSELGRGREGW